MNTAANRNPFVFPQTESEAPRGRLILPKARKAQGYSYDDETPQTPGPQAYVPYAPARPIRHINPPRRKYAEPDNAMMPIAIVGLAVTMFFGLPVGIFTGPSALSRARAVESKVRAGLRPESDMSQVTGARICAWIALVTSAVILAIWAMVAVILLVALA